MLDRLLQAAVVAAWWRWRLLYAPAEVFAASAAGLNEYHRMAFLEGVSLGRRGW